MKTKSSPTGLTLGRLNSPDGHATLSILILITGLLGFFLVGCASDDCSRSGKTTVYREGSHGGYVGTGQQSSQFPQPPQGAPSYAGQQQLPPPQLPSPIAPQQTVRDTGELQHIHMSQNVRVTNSPPALISIPPTSSSTSTYQHPGNTANGGGVIVVVNVTNNNVNNVYQPTGSKIPPERPSTTLIFQPVPAGTLPRATPPVTAPRSSRTNAPAARPNTPPPTTPAPTTP